MRFKTLLDTSYMAHVRPVFPRHLVSIPIISACLIPEHRGLRMRGLGEVPLDTKVFSKSDKEDTFSLLGDAVVGRVQDLRNNAVI